MVIGALREQLERLPDHVIALERNGRELQGTLNRADQAMRAADVFEEQQDAPGSQDAMRLGHGLPVIVDAAQAHSAHDCKRLRARAPRSASGSRSVTFEWGRGRSHSSRPPQLRGRRTRRGSLGCSDHTPFDSRPGGGLTVERELELQLSLLNATH